MKIIGTPSPAADFDHPFEMLAACHDRIEDRLQILERLLDHVRQHGLDQQARQAAANVIRYFDTAGEHHHEDEERDVFPALRSRGADARTLELVARLERDHERMRVLWHALREPLNAIADGASVTLDPAAVDRDELRYREHITLEESKLLPVAADLLDADAQAAIGGAMAARRGVKR
jgi:hemerythrin-like domain-containing protein